MSDQRPPGDVHPSANIQDHAAVYEIENTAADPDARIEAAMRGVHRWDGLDVLDVGCGTGFHLPRFAAAARSVTGVEPHAASLGLARRRCRDLDNVSLLAGSAEYLPLQDDSVDIVHARFAYFFGPRCEPGIAECVRVLRPGGVIFVVDNDLRSGTFAAWLARSPWPPQHSADIVEDFWREQGFTLQRVPSRWQFATRHDLEAVLHIEFPAALAAQLCAEHSGVVVEYHYALYWRRV